MKVITDADSFREAVGSRFFEVEFLKKDGTVRKMHGQHGVKKYVKGTDKRSYLPSDVIVVYDLEKEDYRQIRFDSLLSLKCGDEQWVIESEATRKLGS